MNPTIARARNLALDGQVPDWIELLPAGPTIEGQDGRAWTLPDPQTVVAAFARRHASLVIDWEHASEHRAPHGLDAPAAGWIDELQVRDGAVWGRVTWTERATAQIAAREYRYLSPVFTYAKADARIVQLVSVGLTNQPNLSLTALNREESPVSLPVAVLTALALGDAATEADAIAAITRLRGDLATATNAAATPALDKFVPRADYDAVLSRASNAEQKLATLETARRQAQIDALIARALAETKIAPVTADYYRAMCQTEGGIAQFETFLTQAPALLPDAAVAPAAPPPPTAPTALNRAAFEALSPVARLAHLAQRGAITD
jgi:phage I-like protein